LSRTNRVSHYQKKHSTTDMYPDHQSLFICFLQLLRSMASSLSHLRAWRSFCTTAVSLLWSTSWPGTLNFILHTFIHPIIVFFRSTCPYHRNLFYRSTEIMSSNPNLSQTNAWNLSRSFMPHIHLTILISAVKVPPHFPFLWVRSHFHAAYCFTHNCCIISLTINDTSLLVSNGTNCLNLFHPIRILVSTTASASPSTQHVT